MSLVTLLASLALAAIFAIAAATKLADRGGTREAVVAFGAPEWSAGALTLLLPLAELTVAGLLLWPETALYGAIGALVLLAIFSVAIGVSLARGRAPDCHCFGQLHSAPASWRTLARNGVLAALAVVSLVGNLTDDQASAIAWLGDLEGAELLALVVAAFALGVIVVGGAAFLTLMRSYGRVLTRLDRVEAALASAGYGLDDEPMPELGLAPRHAGPGILGANPFRRAGRARHVPRDRAAGGAPLHEPAMRALLGAHAHGRRLAARLRGDHVDRARVRRNR